MSPEEVKKNMAEIKDKLQKIGLPDAMLPLIKEKMGQSTDNSFFVYFDTMVDHHPVQASIGFQRQGPHGWYNPDIMGVILNPDRNNKIDKNIFLLMEHSEVSIREAYNLMQGRPVFRPMTDSSQPGFWLTLIPLKVINDLNTPELQKSGLIVEKTLAVSPLSSLLSPDQKKEVIAALQEGNRYVLEVPLNERIQRVYLEVNLEENRIDLRKGNRELVDLKDIKPAQQQEKIHTLPGLKKT